MTEAQGQVVWVGTNKVGKNTFHSFKLDDGEFYRTGVKEVVKKGDTISFTFDAVVNGKYTNNEVKTESVVFLNEPTTVDANKAASGYKGKSKATGKDDYWEKRAENDKETQRRISYQAATNTAVAIMNTLLAQEAVSLGSAKAKKVDTYMAELNKVVDIVFEKYQTIGATEEAEQQEESDNNAADIDN